MFRLWPVQDAYLAMREVILQLAFRNLFDQLGRVRLNHFVKAQKLREIAFGRSEPGNILDLTLPFFHAPAYAKRQLGRLHKSLLSASRDAHWVLRVAPLVPSNHTPDSDSSRGIPESYSHDGVIC
jgi:hypothetical protein